MPMTVLFEDEDLPVLRQILDRALNTWEPVRRPQMLVELSDRLDRHMGTDPKSLNGMLPPVRPAPKETDHTGSEAASSRSEQ